MILQLQNGELKIAGSNFADNQFPPDGYSDDGGAWPSVSDLYWVYEL